MKNTKSQKLMLEELIVLPTEELENLTGLKIQILWFEQKGIFTRRNYRVSTIDGSKSHIVKIKSWRLGEDTFKDEYKVSKIGRGLPGTYVLDLA